MSTVPTPLSFSALKRSRGSVEQFAQAIAAASTTKRDDDRYWNLTVDKAGNGHAIIRFLDKPSQDGEDALPWVRTFSHSFQGPGGWLIELCPTTLDQKCPVCESNNTLWNSGLDSDKKIASSRKRKLAYTANILVVSDPANPENDGKVKLFKFGKKIFDKMYLKMHTEFPDEVPFKPFDLWDGANFKLRARKVDGQRNYDISEFAAQTPVSTDEVKLEAIWKSEMALKPLLDQGNFKTYDQLKVRLERVLGPSGRSATAEQVGTQAFNDVDAGVKVESVPGVIDTTKENDITDDDDMKFFQNLADGE